MNTQNLRIALLAGIVGASLATGVQAFAQDHDMGGMKMSGGAMQPGAMKIHELMMQMGQNMAQMKMPMDGDTDRMFAKNMAEHHGIGIKMAQIEVQYGNDAATKAMAKKIIATQSKERPQLEKLGMKAK